MLSSHSHSPCPKSPSPLSTRRSTVLKLAPQISKSNLSLLPQASSLTSPISSAASSTALNVASWVASTALSTTTSVANMLSIPQMADKYVSEDIKAFSTRILATSAGLSLHAIGDLIDIIADKANQYDLTPASSPTKEMETDEDIIPLSPTESSASTAYDPGDQPVSSKSWVGSVYGTLKHHVSWQKQPPKQPMAPFTWHDRLKQGVSLIASTGVLDKHLYQSQASKLFSYLVPDPPSYPHGITIRSLEAFAKISHNTTANDSPETLLPTPKFVFCASASSSEFDSGLLRSDLRAARAVKEAFKQSVLDTARFGGVGYAAIIALVMCLDLNLDKVEQALDNFDKDCDKRFLGAISSASAGLTSLLTTLLKHTTDSTICEKTRGGRLTISLSKYTPGRGFHSGALTADYHTSFSSKSDLISVLLASCYIPVYHETMTPLPGSKGVIYLGGMFTHRQESPDDTAVLVNVAEEDDVEGEVAAWVGGGIEAGVISVCLLRDWTRYI